MICRLTDNALMGVKLLMFNVYGIIGIPKVQFSHFTDTEKIKKN